MKKLYIFILIAFIGTIANAQNYQWAKSIGSASNDYGEGIAIDSSGNCYITGSFSGTADFDPGVGTVNLTSVGTSDIFIAGRAMNNYSIAQGGSDIFSVLSNTYKMALRAHINPCCIGIYYIHRYRFFHFYCPH